MKRIKIFISSVQSEFTNERSMLCDYIRTDVLLGKFFEPFIFEEVPANEYSPQQLYLKEVEICDIYLGIYGNMYGNEDSEGISPTEREYDLATAMHKARIIYIKSLNEEARQAKESALINKVEREIVRKTFVDNDSLRTSVYASLIRYLSEKEYIRWQPFDASYDCDATLIDLDEDKMHALSSDVEIGNARETFFANQLKQGHTITFSGQGDFLIDGQYTIEVGGKDKTFDQIKDLPNSFLAIDDAEYGHQNKIPLWLFGFLY